MTTYILNEAKMFSDIADGVAIVINSETGIYYGMNGFGSAVFENILAGAAIEAILDAVKCFDGAPEDMDARMADFVNDLKSFEIVLEGGASGDVVLDAAVAAGDNFALTVTEYDDAQELLLADPIHEIKEEVGWRPDKIALETDEEIIRTKEAKMK
ncbi:MAG: PqqD family protein [Desulfovibrio sp.]|uniref:PqqD family protein n=1 Tax=Desulfovibrio sp. TaxID=885 RepID=UPI0025897C34|nr:PqqD family protein [Desulfovibrio sp.]MCD7985109.1 PqqD family protein [Desulfovibrio sp.]